jgi:hypothetical protein
LVASHSRLAGPIRGVRRPTVAGPTRCYRHCLLRKRLGQLDAIGSTAYPLWAIRLLSAVSLTTLSPALVQTVLLLSGQHDLASTLCTCSTHSHSCLSLPTADQPAPSAHTQPGTHPNRASSSPANNNHHASEISLERAVCKAPDQTGFRNVANPSPCESLQSGAAQCRYRECQVCLYRIRSFTDDSHFILQANGLAWRERECQVRWPHHRRFPLKIESYYDPPRLQEGRCVFENGTTREVII